MLIEYKPVLISSGAECRMHMSCIGYDPLPCIEIYYGKPYRDKDSRLISFTQSLVYTGKYLRGSAVHHGLIPYERPCRHHEKRCRDALIGHIGYHESDMVIICQEEIIEVACHISCRLHIGIDRKFITIGKSRKLSRKDA